ncbi:MAG: hypothetical protein FWG67_08395 [Defluviitaleaceae bacterium]|nr:hypothetical protein [Defluviitaleaceae bacterium]
MKKKRIATLLVILSAVLVAISLIKNVGRSTDEEEIITNIFENEEFVEVLLDFVTTHDLSLEEGNIITILREH